MAKIEAVLGHRRMLVNVRTPVLHHVQDQITKLPVDIRDQLTTTGKTQVRLRRLENINTSIVSTLASEYRLSWLIPLVDQDELLAVRSASSNATLIDRPTSTAPHCVTKPAGAPDAPHTHGRCTHWPPLLRQSSHPSGR